MDTIGPLLARAQLADRAGRAALATARVAVDRAKGRGASDYATRRALGLAEEALGDAQALTGPTDAAASYRAAYEAFTSRGDDSKDQLVDPIESAEAAIALARRAPAEEARRLLDGALATLGALERAHRLVPRGAVALANARALSGSTK